MINKQSIEEQFVEELSAKLAANNIDVIREVSAIYALFEASFPLESGRIDWSLIVERGESEVKGVSAFYGVDHDQACKFYLREQIAINDLSGRAYFINDSIDIVLVGNVRAFEEVFENLMWPHGHIYLLGEKGDWCLNVTFEDDLYFGFAPPRTLSS